MGLHNAWELVIIECPSTRPRKPVVDKAVRSDGEWCGGMASGGVMARTVTKVRFG